VLLTTANTNDSCGEDRREAELLGAIDDLGRLLSIDECFRNNESWTQGADSRLQGTGHSKDIPFAK
jgi:hypothetical protein